jgi:hypothetical protein
MITVTKIPVQTVEMFDDNNQSLGFLNESEFNDVRCQIAEQKVSGYYLIFDGLKIDIEPTGKIKNWVSGLFDTNENLLARMFKANI